MAIRRAVLAPVTGVVTVAVATAVVVVAVARVRGRVTTGDRDAVVVFGSAWRCVGWSTRAMVVVIEVLSATALVFASSPLLLVRSAAMASALVAYYYFSNYLAGVVILEVIYLFGGELR